MVRRNLPLLLVCLVAPLSAQRGGDSYFPIPSYYGIGAWNSDSLGNHRIVVNVRQKADAVLAHIPWRRRDRNPEQKGLVIIDASSGKKILNVSCVSVNREFGDIVFQPATVPGNYYVYYLLYRANGTNYPKGYYLPIEQTADPSWLRTNNLVDPERAQETASSMEEAELVQFQSIDEFNSFYPMEVIATKSETERLLKVNRRASYLLFPEDRKFPIRMTTDLPAKWIMDGPRKTFGGFAHRGEFYAFQIGLYAARTNIEGVNVRMGELKQRDGGSTIPSSEFMSFNTGGVDWQGNRFERAVRVKQGTVQALWMGIQVPKDAAPGAYTGEITVSPKGLIPTKVKMRLDVSDLVLEDAGDSDPYRLLRLRWLDSQLAADDSIVAPFIPMTVQDTVVTCLGRTLAISSSGFAQSIRSFFSPVNTALVSVGRELLAAPIHMVVENSKGKQESWKNGRIEITKQTPGAVAWTSHGSSGPFETKLDARMEFDGYVDYRVTFIAKENASVKDIRLEIPLRKDAAKYSMGMGLKGGFCPDSFSWTWNPERNQDAFWVGDVNAGLECSFRDENYSRPLNTNFYQFKPLTMPPSWYNDGKGGFRFGADDSLQLQLISYSGPRKIRAGEELHFDWTLLITPFKVIKTDDQWSTRYYHKYQNVNEIATLGANTINVHHATEINPYLNYPFLRPKQMRAYIDSAHALGMKVKIYYTVRELSDHAPELIALRSLGDEILAHGSGGGSSWLKEHLDQDYIPGWYVPELHDASIITSGVSRWHNYYVEGLQWLAKNVGIDGLYIDDVAFDRTTMKRVRKVLERNRPGALIDLHSANQFNPRDGFVNSTLLYMEHFPYIDRLWFGEYFDYDSKPDYWLTEISGIPFGLMGEMLEKGGNPWRGMAYGMTNRLPWSGDPTPLWKLWDEFGMKGTKMFGYWSENCPVKTDNQDVLATAYVKENESLISIASWASDTVRCSLSINWKSLGLDSTKVSMEAPAVKNFQDHRRFSVGERIPIPPGKGWLLELKQE